MQLSILFAILLYTSLVIAQNPCVPRIYDGGIVCVCDADYCDTIGEIPDVMGNDYIIYTTNIEGLRFDMERGTFSDVIQTGAYEMRVDYTRTYQKMFGFGGSFTDASGININSLSDNAQENLLKSYFSPDGIELNMARVPIGGCDFSDHPYSYADVVEDDTELVAFNLTMEDFAYKIPLIHRAMQMSTKDIQLMSAAWSPPLWMKKRGQWAGGFLKEEYYRTWANYQIKFLDAYKEEGIEFWSLSTGNEPLGGLLPVYGFNSLAWTPPTQFKWIKEDLGPALKASSHTMTKLLAVDDQRDMITWWTNAMKNDTEAADYIDGIGVHWYLDRISRVSVLDKTHEDFPNKFILGTEACVGDKPWEDSVDLGSWERGEKYMKSIIEDVNHWFVGWTDWNLALDLMGGPNWAENYVDAGIIVNATADEFYKQPMFYALGHFSKFVSKDAVRVRISPNMEEKVQSVAFHTPANKTVVVIFNENNAKVPITIVDPSKGSINLIISERSYQTVIYDSVSGVASLRSQLLILVISLFYVFMYQ